MSLRQSIIFVHRWLGVVLSLLFLTWFLSGIGLMYWDFPSVSREDRLERAPALDPSTMRVLPADAAARVDASEWAPVVLTTFDSRPAYRFGGRGRRAIVYADTGEPQREVSKAMVDRIASAWSSQSIASARIESVDDVDQWTLQVRLNDVKPLWKYSWPDGQQVYVSQASGEVEQYTTTASRWGAYVGAIPHWLYFTPLRKDGPTWSKVVIWTSAVGTGASIMGIVIGVWMYSPSKKYRNAGAPTSIPYRGQKRWHTIFGLVFGLGAATWAFSGLLSMDPFPRRTNRPVGGGEQLGRFTNGGPRSVQAALRGRASLDAFESKRPKDALTQLSGLQVKELEITSIVGGPAYLATLADGDTRIVPVDGEPIAGFTSERITEVVTRAAGKDGLTEIRTIDQYDMYYLDR